MLNKIYFSLISIFLITPNFLLSQSTIISGKIKDKSGPIPFAKLMLVSEGKVDTFVSTSDFTGQYEFAILSPGEYNLKVEFVDFIPQSKTLLVPTKKDTLIVDFILDPCERLYALRSCPICQKANKVIRVNYQIGFTYNFESKEKEAEYHKINKRQGYVTHWENGCEYLWAIDNKSENEKLLKTSICDKLLFCKRDKTIFR